VQRKHAIIFSSQFLILLSILDSLGFLPRGSEGSIRKSFGRERVFVETSARGVEQALSHDSNDPQFKWWKNKSRNCESQYIDIMAL
jgi:hypothetical protein